MLNLRLDNYVNYGALPKYFNFQGGNEQKCETAGAAHLAEKIKTTSGTIMHYFMIYRFFSPGNFSLTPDLS